MNEVAQVVTGVVGGGGALTVWLFKRWMVRVDAKLDGIESAINRLTEKTSELHTAIALANERNSNIYGRLDQLHRSIEMSHQDIGALSKAVQKLWDVLSSKGLSAKRFSDQAMGE